MSEVARMARSFVAHYLIFCESVEYVDSSRPHRNSILNRVDYVLSAPSNTEFPFEPSEFWLFARFYWLRDRVGSTPPLTVSCVWLDPPSGQQVEVWRRKVGRVSFHQPYQIADRAWVFRNFPDGAPYPFPGAGRYEFRLWCPIRRLGRRHIKSEFIRVEV